MPLDSRQIPDEAFAPRDSVFVRTGFTHGAGAGSIALALTATAGLHASAMDQNANRQTPKGKKQQAKGQD